MKKFLSAILSFAMIFALSIPAFAADITVAPTETVTNEYQSMLELQKISNATLGPPKAIHLRKSKQSATLTKSLMITLLY